MDDRKGDFTKVYVKTDKSGNVTSVNSSIFLLDTAGWTKIDEGYGDMYIHAMWNYFQKPLVTQEGIWRYRLRNGKVVEKTKEEIRLEKQSAHSAAKIGKALSFWRNQK